MTLGRMVSGGMLSIGGVSELVAVMLLLLLRNPLTDLQPYLLIFLSI